MQHDSPWLRAALSAAILLAVRCDRIPELPSVPEGVTIFVDGNYSGKSVTLDSDQPNLDEVRGPCPQGGSDPYYSVYYTWNDCISSIRLSPGWEATVYGDEDYHGSTLDVSGDIPDLRKVPGKCGEGLNDCISSIHVYRRN